MAELQLWAQLWAEISRLVSSQRWRTLVSSRLSSGSETNKAENGTSELQLVSAVKKVSTPPEIILYSGEDVCNRRPRSSGLTASCRSGLAYLPTHVCLANYDAGWTIDRKRKQGTNLAGIHGTRCSSETLGFKHERKQEQNPKHS